MWSISTNFEPKHITWCYLSHVKRKFDGQTHASFDRFSNRQNLATACSSKSLRALSPLADFQSLWFIFLSTDMRRRRLNCFTSVKFSSFEASSMRKFIFRRLPPHICARDGNCTENHWHSPFEIYSLCSFALTRDDFARNHLLNPIRII